MDSSQKFHELFSGLIENVPSLLMLIGCMIAAVVRWKRHPKVSVLILLSMGWLMAHTIISAAVYTWVPDWVMNAMGAMSAEESSRVTDNIFLVLGLISNASYGIAIAVLLAAIFTQRGATNRAMLPTMVD